MTDPTVGSFDSREKCVEQIDAWACESRLPIRSSVIREFADRHWHRSWGDRNTWLKELQNYAAVWEFDRR